MTNAERQKKWREGHKGFAQLRERNYKRRVRAKAEPVTDTPVPNIRPKVPNAIPRYGDDLVRVSMDEAEGDADVMRAHAQAMQKRVGVAPPVRKDPEERVVAPVVITSEERRIEQWLEQKKSRRPAAETNPLLLEGVEVEME